MSTQPLLLYDPVISDDEAIYQAHIQRDKEPSSSTTTVPSSGHEWRYIYIYQGSDLSYFLCSLQDIDTHAPYPHMFPHVNRRTAYRLE